MQIYRSVFDFMTAGPINSVSITHYLLFLLSYPRLLRYQEMSNDSLENYRTCILYGGQRQRRKISLLVPACYHEANAGIINGYIV